MKSETFTEGQGAAFLAALNGKRPKRAKPGGKDIPRPAKGSTRGQVGDWTQGKADTALALGWQLGYDHRLWVYGFKVGERTEAYEHIDDLLAALAADKR